MLALKSGSVRGQ